MRARVVVTTSSGECPTRHRCTGGDRELALDVLVGGDRRSKKSSRGRSPISSRSARGPAGGAAPFSPDITAASPSGSSTGESARHGESPRSAAARDHADSVAMRRAALLRDDRQFAIGIVEVAPASMVRDFQDRTGHRFRYAAKTWLQAKNENGGRLASAMATSSVLFATPDHRLKSPSGDFARTRRSDRVMEGCGCCRRNLNLPNWLPLNCPRACVQRPWKHRCGPRAASPFDRFRGDRWLRWSADALCPSLGPRGDGAITARRGASGRVRCLEQRPEVCLRRTLRCPCAG